MARRRMIGLTVWESDPFLDLPDSARALYPYIITKADDSGLLNNMKALVRTFRAANETLLLLIDTGFIIDFGNGVYAITHWEQQNHVSGSKFTPSVFDEFKQLEKQANGTYLRLELPLGNS